jgi:hypothetical protein
MGRSIGSLPERPLQKSEVLEGSIRGIQASKQGPGSEFSKSRPVLVRIHGQVSYTLSRGFPVALRFA